MELLRGKTASVQAFLSESAVNVRQPVQYWLDVAQLAADVAAVAAPLKQADAFAACMRTHDVVLSTLAQMALGTPAPHMMPAHLASILVRQSKAVIAAKLVDLNDTTAVNMVRLYF